MDTRLDLVLEKHERDFLSAYRFHMVQVQAELTALKGKGNEKELQKKQDRKISQLEGDTNALKADCLALMKYCAMQG